MDRVTLARHPVMILAVGPERIECTQNGRSFGKV